MILGEEIGKIAYEEPHHLMNRIHPDDYEMLIKKINGEVDYSKPIIYKMQTGNGEYTTFEEFTTPVYKNGELVAIQGILRNITEKLKLQEELEYRMIHDGLSGVYNREYFDETMGKYNMQVDTSMAILLCDLDELKHTNDTLGHKNGDLLIKEAAIYLTECYPEDVMVFRIGGDEFAVLFMNRDKKQIVELIEGSINDGVTYKSNTPNIHIKMSKGYSISEHSIGEMDSLFVEADRTMYRDKRRRKAMNGHDQPISKTIHGKAY